MPRTLSTYRAKRDFQKTAEPKGESVARSGNHEPVFMIQKHAATRLHYDFRLEMGGVLRSWAVTRGPSLDPADKRLAVHVEDHPLEYATFEGTIPKGQYGGGTVMLWDRGHWEAVEDAQEGYRRGRLSIRLHGERLKGEWHLVRMQGKASSEKHDNWLLIKAHDGQEKAGDGDHALSEFQTSVVSGRTMEQIASQSDNVWTSKRAAPRRAGTRPVTKIARKVPNTKVPKARRAQPMPQFIAPQLATQTAVPIRAEGWIHEIKFDGYRLMARLESGKVSLLTRTDKDWTGKFQSVADALAQLDASSAMFDGEVVVLDDHGVPSFSELQQALKDNALDRFHYYLFDLLYLDGRDLRELPLVERKAQLSRLIPEGHPRLHFSKSFSEPGDQVFQHACQMGLEGIISKRADGRYVSGRGEAWLKCKCHQAQELVIGGFTWQTGHNGTLGALLLGYYQDGELVFGGKAGTGFSQSERAALIARLVPLIREAPPFSLVPPGYGKGAVWTEPKLVAQIEFTEWTRDGVLRHPSYQGMREDKPAKEVVREVAKVIDSHSAKVPKRFPKSTLPKPSASNVVLTHPEKIVYPKVGLTKQEVADYYLAVAQWMLPHVVNRPVSLLRCPDGFGPNGFFQRHAGPGLSPHITPVPVTVNGETRPYLKIEDIDGLIALVQMGALEIHVWGSRADQPARPDRLVFDLDPADDVPWERVKSTAMELRARLTKKKLISFVKTTGGKGLHVVVPFERGPDWSTVKEFTRALAATLVTDAPSQYTINMRKSERPGRIFIDYLRNDLTATAIAPYSTRNRATASVAAPIDWDELPGLNSPAAFTVENMSARLVELARHDPWAKMGSRKQKLPGR